MSHHIVHFSVISASPITEYSQLKNAQVSRQAVLEDQMCILCKLKICLTFVFINKSGTRNRKYFHTNMINLLQRIQNGKNPSLTTKREINNKNLK